MGKFTISNEVVSVTWKGREYYAGMIEPDDEIRGWWHYSLYWENGGGNEIGKRNAIAKVKKECKEAMKSGVYFKCIEAIEKAPE